MSPAPSRLGSTQAAANLLTAAGVAFNKIVQDCDDSVLYLDEQDQPRTAWIHQHKDGVAISTEPGFVDWPSDGVELLAVPIIAKEKT